MWPYFFMLVVHWFADFVMQTRAMANNKSKSLYYLTLHVLVYTISTMILWTVFMPLFFGIECSTNTILLAMGLIFLTHWPTDKITSNITKYFYAKGNEKMFFTTIGFDQVLHFLQLFWIFDNIILK